MTDRKPALDPAVAACAAHAASAFEMMAKWRIPATPENYRVWYSYCASTLPSLRRTVDILLSNGQELGPAVSGELHARYFGSPVSMLEHLTVGIEDSVTRALSAINDAGADARHYGMSLDSTAASLAGEDGTARIREVVRQVMIETRTMIERNDLLEQELSRSTQEIGQLRKQVEAASREAMTDPLTGIGNRKMFDLRLKHFMQQAMENGTELCLLLVDIDHFKAFNDNYGHQFGDLVLRLVAKLLREGIRQDDHAARFGGEEFTILLPGAGLDAGLRVADQLRSKIATRAIVKRDTKQNLGSVTVSIGVACYRLGEPAAGLIERADEALYRAKATGRNRVLTEASEASASDALNAAAKL